uniref:atlastin-like n=1 Tax=Styela clava TaxID=7725 RepID=UPI0019397495|nr:atlastin-like [Styela clava]
MKAKPIAEITAEGKFKLNVGNLTAVLHNLKCQDLAIVSMAGAYRTGKSFMLNFFIRYLRNEGWKNKYWFGPGDMKIQDGFNWSRGSKPHTLGIYVCSEIFHVEKDGKQLSLKYALAASRHFSIKEKSFQKLTFLVRDWYSFEYRYGHGGDEYIDGILKNMNPRQPESVTQAKGSIHSGFEHVNGFLMSRPNKEIDGGEGFLRLQNSGKYSLCVELRIKSLQISSEIKRNKFSRKIKSYECRYEENFENIFSNTMQEILEEFDEETEDQGDSLDEKILLEARIDLGKTMEEVLIEGMQTNNVNKGLIETRVADAVKACVLKYQEALEELMIKSYVEAGGFEVIERHYIEKVDARYTNEAFKELIKEEIRKETEEAKKKNEENKEYKTVTADENTVADYLAIGLITITFPIWVPLGLVGLLLGGLVAGVVTGVVKLKDLIKKKMNSKK